MAASNDQNDHTVVVLSPIECWDDLYRLPGFQEKVAAAVMKEGIPIRPYSMSSRSERKECGIAECRTPHLHGYVIQIGNGLSNVGHRCASKYFGKTQWKAHLKQLRQNQKEQAAKEALEQSRVAARALVERVATHPRGYEEVTVLLSLFDTLPRGLRAELMERAHPLVPREEVFQRLEPTDAEIARAKFHEKPRPQATLVKVGAISGLKAVAENSRADVVSVRMDRQKTALLMLASDDAATTDELTRAMHEFNKTAQLLGRAMERAHVFFSESNLREIEKLPGGSKFREIFSRYIIGSYTGAA